MKIVLLKKLREAVAEWARMHNIETTTIEAKFSGLGAGVHVLVVARQGFENWRWAERERGLFRFISNQFKTLSIQMLRTGMDCGFKKASR